MPDRIILFDEQTIKVGGSPLTKNQTSKVKHVIVDSSLHVPDMFIIRLEELESDNADAAMVMFKLSDALTKFKVGATVKLDFPTNDGNSKTTVLEGEVTALEPEFAKNLVSLTVRGYAKSHRLHRAAKTKAWMNITDSDIASQIANTYSLTPQVDSTSETYDIVFQHAQTDFAFLTERAERIGYIVYTENGKLHFEKQTGPSSAVATLEWGDKNLISFTPRLTVSEKVSQVTVKGWDPKAKQAVTGTASSSSTEATAGIASTANSGASSLGNAEKIVTRKVTLTQSDATTIANGILNSLDASMIAAEGEIEGDPSLHAGVVIEIKGVGTDFSGKYRLTTVRHQFSAGTYHTVFTVEGTRPDLLSYLVESPKLEDENWGGIVTALVTNNADTENKSGMKGAVVTLKYPWLSDNDQTFWARVGFPGAGAQRGIYFMPEVNDEVLVAFEHGDFNRPYVIGSVYNGTDAPPNDLAQTVTSSGVKTRVIKTRTGHSVTFVDEDSGEEYIEIKDAKGNTSVKFDAANKTITMNSQDKVNITSTGDISIKSQGNINIEATSNITVKASSNIDLEGGANATLKAGAALSAQGGASAELKGPSTTVSGDATVSVKSPMTQVNGDGMLELKGGVVMIN